MAVNDATARPASKVASSALGLRAVSAFVLAPPVLLALYAGSPYFEVLLAAAAVVLVWEWNRLSTGGIFGIGGTITALAVVAALAGLAMGRPELSPIAYAAGAGALLCVSLSAKRAIVDGHTNPPFLILWQGAGMLCIGIPCLALLWLRSDPHLGRETVIWLFAVVWCVDIGAYAFGRLVGGPRLAPMISPNKTWAGLIGGAACAAVAGAVAAVFLEKAGWGPLAAVSAGIAVVAQGGDLVESALKRHFRVKDASSIIPGHGGLLDRVDGLLAASVAVALLGMTGGGGVLTWT